MTNFWVRALVSLVALRTVIVGAEKLYSTSIETRCVTRTGVTGTGTTTFTTTKYIGYISTVSVAPTTVVSGRSTAITVNKTDVHYTGTSTTTRTVTGYVDDVELTLITVPTEISTFLVTFGTKTRTQPPPKRFTPIASNSDVIKLGGVTSALWPDQPYTLRYPQTTPTANIAPNMLAANANRVVCHVTYFLETTTTQTLRGSSTVTSTSYSTTSTRITTITTIPGVSTLSTYATTYSTYTEYLTGYTWNVTTTTIIATVPTAVAYPACNSSNIISGFGGYNISARVQYDNYGYHEYYAEESPYTCCVRCFERPDCTAAFYHAFYLEYYPVDLKCLLLFLAPEADCKPRSVAYNFSLSEFWEADVWIMNGPCGQGKYVPMDY